MHVRAIFLTAIIATVCVACTPSSGPSRQRSASAGSPAMDLESEYIIGPQEARKLGLRIDFQTQTHPEQRSGVKMLSVQGKAIFVLDGLNFLTRLRRAGGQRLWRLPIAGPVDDIEGITYQPSTERVFLTSTSNILVLDDGTGSMIDKQDLDQIASTAPVQYGEFLIYGSRSGQIVWHSYEVGYQWRAYQVSPTIRVAPLLINDIIVAIGSDGRVMVLDAPSAASIWSKTLLNEVTAAPATDNGLLYIAGLDQYLWAIRITDGRTLWKYLTDVPLDSPPAAINGQIYQQIRGKGLYCFAARPLDKPGGELLWKTPGVNGNVIGGRDHRLFVWDADGRVLNVVDAARGGVMETVSLPQVRHLLMRDKGEVFAASDDGRVIALVPRD